MRLLTIANDISSVYRCIHHWLTITSGFGQWKERVKTDTICGGQSMLSSCVQKTVSVCRMCVHVRVWYWPGVGQWVCGCSHPLTSLHEWCTMGSSGDAVLYHEVSKNTQLQTHIHHLHLYPTQTLSADTVRKHRLTLHVCCCSWPIPVSVGFTGSFTPTCHASPHCRTLNTVSLCGHSSAWEGFSPTHHIVFIS